MSRRRWALPLFVAALVVFWGGLGLSGALFPEREGDRIYAWSAQDAAEVRQVVVDVPDADWMRTELTWSTDEPPQLQSSEPAYAAPRLVLVREGEVLYIRANPQAHDGQAHDVRRSYARRLQLRLPMQVVKVTGRMLELNPGPAPRRLELQGDQVEVMSSRLNNDIEHLLVVGLGVRCGRESGLTVQASRVQALEVDVLRGAVSLDDFGHLPAVPVRGPQDVVLKVDQIGKLGQVRWSEMPAEREAALQAIADPWRGDTDDECNCGTRRISAKSGTCARQSSATSYQN